MESLNGMAIVVIVMVVANAIIEIIKILKK